MERSEKKNRKNTRTTKKGMKGNKLPRSPRQHIIGDSRLAPETHLLAATGSRKHCTWQLADRRLHLAPEIHTWNKTEVSLEFHTQRIHKRVKFIVMISKL